MIPLIFVLGTLLGILAGGALCISYLRLEIPVDIGSQLKRMQNQLDDIESAINLALVTRYAERNGRRHPDVGWHYESKRSFEPSRANLTPQHKAGPMLAHRPSAITPTLQPVTTIGMWWIWPTVPLAPIAVRSTAFSLS
jgi:hypothetical protein